MLGKQYFNSYVFNKAIKEIKQNKLASTEEIRLFSI